MDAETECRLKLIAEKIINESYGSVLISEITIPAEDLEYVYRHLFHILNDTPYSFLHGLSPGHLDILSAFALVNIGIRNYKGKELWPAVDKACCESIGYQVVFTY